MGMSEINNVLNEAYALNSHGKLSDAYNLLGSNGDNYAVSAAKIVDGKPDILENTVRHLWDTISTNYTDKGGYTCDDWENVATQHQKQYLDIIKKENRLPTTYEIESSYAKALLDNGLPAEMAVDILINTANIDSANPKMAAWFETLGLDPSRVSEEQLVTLQMTPENAHALLMLSGMKGQVGYIVDYPECFAPSTLISTPSGHQAISDLRIGDLVMAFDPTAEYGRGKLVPKRVANIFRNRTREWFRLTWLENGEQKELVTTPGHHFLREDGLFGPIADIVENGQVRIVLETGDTALCEVEHIVYSEETAHLFERTQSYGIAGSSALAAEPADEWQSYNFEVEDHHTYVAGGARVHNDCVPMGYAPPKNIFQKISDGIANTVNAVASAVGNVVSKVAGAVSSVAKKVAEAVSNVVKKVAQAVSETVKKVAKAVSDTVKRIAESVSKTVKKISKSISDTAKKAWESVKKVWKKVTGQADPIVVDLDGYGAEVTEMSDSAAKFDFDDDGFAERTAWADNNFIKAAA